MAEAPIRVLVVDDSAYLRKVITQMLRSSLELEVVGFARDGVDALDCVERLQPDVVTVDLNMPMMDGVEFMREQMRRRPVAFVVVSIASEEGYLAAQALESGAVEFVRKPTGLASEKVLEIQQELVDKVLAAGRVPRARLAPLEAFAPPAPLQEPASGPGVLVLGLSTGGPQALRYLLSQLPGNFPWPIAAVVHMPVGYTGPFAGKLDEISQLEVKEASAGLYLQPGRVVLAQAGFHLRLRRRMGQVCCELDLQPSGLLHRPSVDILFQSAAEVYGSNVLAVVLTGMGEDGKAGSGWVKAQGGRVLAEHESSCVIYGMPRSVIEAGLADAAYPLLELPDRILSLVQAT
ncbi:chemotaxis-specific protein-glutamate methyltransferase CheB [bacterium]|nr:chemotaxis-specific protein-glutamate methyltransferase CheB [bacterium]